MNIFKFFITAIMIGSTMAISAANTSETTDLLQKESPEQAYYQWKVLYQKCVNNYDSCITLGKNDEKKLKKLKMTEDDFNNYKNLCSKLESSIELMYNKDVNTTIDFDINEWYKLSCSFKDVIKSNLKDMLEKDNNSWEEAKTWEEKCTALKDYYSKLATEYNEAKYYYAETLVAENNNQKSIISKLENEIKDLKQNYERPSSSNLLTENKKLKSAATQAFEVCLFYPLAVKYKKEYVDYAYDAAKKLIDAEIHTETLAMKNDWDKYSPLLKNYGLYNTNVINYINWCKSEITKYKGNISINDITYFKDKLKFYYDLYKTNVTITYLDNVIDEFYSMLEKNVSKNENIGPNAIDNFIRIYLK